MDSKSLPLGGSDFESTADSLMDSHGFKVGTKVKKKHADGWQGVVESEPSDGYVNVLWKFEKRSVREAVENLEVIA